MKYSIGFFAGLHLIELSAIGYLIWAIQNHAEWIQNIIQSMNHILDMINQVN